MRGCLKGHRIDGLRMESRLLLLTLLLLASCLALALGQEGMAVESDDELEADLSDPSGQEEVPENWSVENKLDSADKFFHGRYYSNTYDQINSELVAKVPSRNREPNMKFAAEWLANLTSTGKVGFFKVHLVEALKQFTALQTTLNSCDRHSYAILFKNDKATRGRGHVPPSRSRELRRIDRMVYLFSLEHAIHCLPRYQQLLEAALARHGFREALLYQEATVVSHRPELVKKTNREDNNSLSLLMKMDSGHICRNNADVAMAVIRQLAGEQSPDLALLHKSLDERRGKFVVDKEKVRYLVQKYLVGPCEFLIRELGSTVILPARYDVLMLEAEDFDHGPSALQDLNFKLGQARYRFCKLLVRNQSSLIGSLAKKINSSG